MRFSISVFWAHLRSAMFSLTKKLYNMKATIQQTNKQTKQPVVRLTRARDVYH
jgi:hypothetical protein